MLTLLRIKNLALVDDLTLELPPGYVVVTGETGTGKSIIIGALKLVLGERADRSLLRAGTDACTVEAVFDIAKLQFPLPAILERHGLEPCEDDKLVLKRVVTASGNNRQFVNGSPTTLTILAAVSAQLVDMHGPHDHQSLLDPAQQLAILDAYAELHTERAAFTKLVDSRKRLLAQQQELQLDDATHAQQLDLLRFQIEEIDRAELDHVDEEEVEQEYQRATNAARLIQLGTQSVDAIVENEASLLSHAATVSQLLQELAQLDPSTAPLLEQHQLATENLREIASNLSSYIDRIDVDPARFQELEERLNLIQSLKRKYGSTLAAVLAFKEDAQVRLQRIELQDETLARIKTDLRQLDKALLKAGLHLTEKRRRTIPRLCREVCRHLKQLGFATSQLHINLQSTPLEPDQYVQPLKRSGFDSVEFQFAPNPGEPAQPLRAIASSGELARVMLALKTVLAAQDEVPVLVFDEADSNVGGETARAVGDKMRQIADRRQVICITHLPQVAAPASHHFVVTKTLINGRTQSRITRVSETDRVRELSRMLGGQTEAATKHAQEMLARQ